MPPTLVFGDAKELRLDTVWDPRPSSLSPAETMFLFDWDDTLLCSEWLCRTKGFSLKTQLPPTQEMMDICEKLSAVVIHLLTRAKELGQVMIITNAMEGWVERSCAIFMPSLLPLLATIHIVSAQARYRPRSPLPHTWKELTFRDELMWRVLARTHGGRMNIISIGDGQAEQEAIRSFGRSNVAEGATTKSIKLMDKPDPDALIRQLEAITDTLDPLVRFPETLDLQIGLLDIPTPITTRGPE